MVKFFQGMAIQKDPKMRDSILNSDATVQTSRLMEELGQVEYIFSDKTGTLTCNIMQFKNLSVLGESYGN
jgi:phospholipid-transporting ATPase